MTLTKVLEMLYGKVASGYLQATYIENGKCRSKCFQIDQLSEMESFIRKYGKNVAEGTLKQDIYPEVLLFTEVVTYRSLNATAVND